MTNRKPDLSVIIPAHNEEAVIKNCLEPLLADLNDGRIEVIVVCNGCSDRTAEISRAASHLISVVEAPVASKHEALNFGDELAHGRHRAYLDADTVLSPGALMAVKALLETPGVHAASPEVAFDVTNCSWAARQFHRIWAQSPYFSQRTTLGAGFYALSEEGRARFDRFPEAVGDDYFVASTIDEAHRATARGVTFTPLLPTSLRQMLNVHIRHYGAHVELTDQFSLAGRADELAPPPQDYRWLRPLLRSLANWPGIALFVAVKIAAKPLGKRKARKSRMKDWNRDDDARTATTS